MFRKMCKGKIHRATVTEAELDYVGSITIDAELMRQAHIRPYEMVQVTSLRNASLWHTYAIPGESGSGTICLNGPPAHLFRPGDLVIILSMGYYSQEDAAKLRPSVVFVDGANRVTRVERHRLDDWSEEIEGESDDAAAELE